MVNYCCENMKYHAEFNCEAHDNKFDCPDNIIYFNKANNKYGLIIHDGGSSFIGIRFCPFCGKELNGRTPFDVGRQIDLDAL